MSESVYERLREHLDTHPVGFPGTEDNADIELLKLIFTPEQAKAMCSVDWRYKTTEELYTSMKDDFTSAEEVGKILKDILKNGGIFYRKKGGKDTWATAPLAIGMYEFQVNRLSPALLDRLKDYWTSAKTSAAPERPSQMRVIPIEKSVEQQLQVAPFDEIQSHVRRAGNQIAILECICRKKRKMEGNLCIRTDREESCMAFLDFADHSIAQGTGRKISAQEAISILQANQKDGLVLMPSNSQEAQFVCSCCPDCCGVLGSLRASERPAEQAMSNFQAQADLDLCSGCGDCAEMCPMDAISVDNGSACVDEVRCIGCGVCVVQCATDAMKLKKKGVAAAPPKTWDDLYEDYIRGAESAR